MRQKFHALSNNVKGMLAAAGTFFFFPICDIFQKMLSATYPPLIMAIYGIFSCLCVLFVISAARGQVRFMVRTRDIRPHIARAVFLTALYTCFLYALPNMPLANVYTLSYTSPFVLTLLGIIFLREHPQNNVLLAMVLGFGGVLVALRPGDWQFSQYTAMALGIGVFLALANLTLRFMRKDDHWITRTALPLIIELGLFIVITLVMGVDFPVPALADIPLFIGTGLFMASGLTLIAYAFSKAPVSVVSPFQYTSLIWGILYGWLFFGDIIDIWTLSGAAIITASGLWLLMEKDKRPAS